MASIYIPRMDIKDTEEFVKIVLQTHYKFGIVNRVDFTAINKKPGFTENTNGSYKSAFVHFECIWAKDKNKKYFWDEIEKGNSYKIYFAQGEYWICLKNKNPVKTSLMNVHQVVENGRYLETLIAEQETRIKEQSNTIEELKEAVKTLLVINGKREVKPCYDEEIQDNNLCLRKRLIQAKNIDYRKYGEDDYDDSFSLSTHSSILPEIVDDDDLEWFESDSNEQTERIKNSCDLCGNE
jgi:hypothetical protein